MATQNEAKTVSPIRTSYFGTDEQFTFVLPDGQQNIIHRKLVEGDRKKLQDTGFISRKAGSDEINIPIKVGSERNELLKMAIVGWSLVGRDGQDVPFSDYKLNQFLLTADPDIVDLIEADIRKHNKFLLLQAEPEDIKKEIARLQEQLAVVEEQAAKNAS